MRILVQMRADGICQRCNKFLGGFKMPHFQQGRRPIQGLELLVGMLEGGFGGGLGIMREHRKQEKFVHAAFFEPLKPASDARVAVAHGEFKLNVVIDGTEIFRHSLRIDPQRRAVFHPYLLVERGDFSRAGSQDDASNEEVAKRCGDVDDIRVKQEFAKIGPHRRYRGFVGCSHVHQQDAFFSHNVNQTVAALTLCSPVGFRSEGFVHPREATIRCF